LGRLTKDLPDSPNIPKFNSKVVSRVHAMIYNVGGKVLEKNIN